MGHTWRAGANAAALATLALLTALALALRVAAQDARAQAAAPDPAAGAAAAYQQFLWRQQQQQQQQQQQAAQPQWDFAAMAGLAGFAAASNSPPPRKRPKQFCIMGNFLPRQLGVVRQSFEELGFRETRSDDPLGWEAAWGTGGSLKKEQFSTLKPTQKFNHFPCTHELGNKDLLWKNLDRARAGLPPDAGFDFFPQSFVLPDDLEFLRNYWAKHPDKMFILKPKYLARGEGIRVLHAPEDLPAESEQGDFIVQEYIANPMLIDGFKTTLRVYVAVTSLDPLRIYLLEEGFVHMSTEKYSTAPDKINNLRVHVTNPDVQGSEYWSQGGGSNYWNLTRFQNMLKTDTQLDPAAVWRNLERMIVKTIISAVDAINDCVRVHSRHGASYEVWGIDVLVDTTGKVWIIEVNHTPSTNTDFPSSREIKRWFVRDLVQMVFPSRADVDKWTEAVHQRLKRIGWDAAQLPQEAIDMLVESEIEYQVSRTGHYKRIYPSFDSVEHPYQFLNGVPYFDRLLHAWLAGFKAEADHDAKLRASKVGGEGDK
jgi:hypothetical protein